MKNFLDQYIQGAMPHIRNAAQVACAYGDRIVTRLDLIYGALQSEEFLEYHPRYSFTLVTNIPQEITQVPVGEMWELEFVSATGAAVVTINEGADLFRFAKSFAAADAVVGVNLIFGSGTVPTIVSSANTTVTTQWKRRRANPSRPSNSAGMIESPDVFRGQPFGERGNDGRHATPLWQGPNVNGHTKGDGLISPY